MEREYSSNNIYSENQLSNGTYAGRLEKLSIALPLRKELKGHLVDSEPI